MRHAVLWALLAVVVGGGLLLGVRHELDERAESRTLAETGQRIEARVMSRRTTGGKSPSYYVRIQNDNSGSTEVQVARSDYDDAHPGRSTPYYWDPVARRGIAEMERGRRESLGGAIVMSLIALLVIFIGGVGLRRAWREMRLFRLGRELFTHGGGLHVRITHEGFSGEVRPPIDRSSLLRVGPAGEELVLLASDDLGHTFFPSLRDVTVERLTRDEMTVTVLDAPVRPMKPAWREWLRRKYRAYPIVMGLLAGLGAITLLAVGGAGGVETPFWITAGCFAFAELLLFLGWMRGFWRDVVLWREGDEVHAVVIDERWENNYRTYTLAFTHRHVERRATIRVPDAFSLLRTSSPPDAPAVTNRVLVLIDPARPKRWAPVPQSCAR